MAKITHEVECLGEEACICPEVIAAYQRGLLTAAKLIGSLCEGPDGDGDIAEAVYPVYKAILEARWPTMALDDDK